MKAFSSFIAVVGHTLFAAAAIVLPGASLSEPLADKHDFLNAQTLPSAENKNVELERLFWMCDYGATAGELEVGQIEMCGAVTEHLKRAKFDGDFDELLAWWRLNKDAQHQALAGAGAASKDCTQTTSRG